MNIYEEISKYEKRQRDEIAKEKKKRNKIWAPFPERHPWIPAIISIIALIVAYTKG